MKKIILVLIIVLNVICQPCYAADIPKREIPEKPKGELVHHDICIYTLAPGEFFLYKEFYPLLDGETRTVPAGTSINVFIDPTIQERLKEATVIITDDLQEFYKHTFIKFDGASVSPYLNSNVFAGNVILSLELKYKDETTEIQKFYFEKEDTFVDASISDKRINASDIGPVVNVKVDNLQKVLYPEKISIISGKGTECFKLVEKKINSSGKIIWIPIALDGLERNYTVTIPEGTLLLDEGLNNEISFEVINDEDFVTVHDFIKSTDPGIGYIKYINGKQEEISVTVVIKNEFKVDTSKQLYINNNKVDYKTDITDSGTVITFQSEVKADKKATVSFDEGMIIASNGDTNGEKTYFEFKVMDIADIDLPEKAIFIDLSPDHWAYEYIIRLAVDDVILGYEDKTFRPEGYVTRAEAAKLLSMVYEVDSKSEYTDLAGHWAESYIKAAGGFLPSDRNEFRPDDYATRQDVAVALVNIIEKVNAIILKNENNEFIDMVLVDDNYIDHINKAVSAGIFSGYDDNTFRPNDNITRAEMATLLCRTLEKPIN